MGARNVAPILRAPIRKPERRLAARRARVSKQRRMLHESLERRQLLTVGGLGLAGDSLTDEYVNEPYGQYAQNWVTLVGNYRSAEIPLGEYRAPTSNPPTSFDAPWGDLRRAAVRLPRVFWGSG